MTPAPTPRTGPSAGSSNTTPNTLAAALLATMFATLLATLLTACPMWAHAGPVHEHGAVQLNVAQEGSTLTIGLEAPLDSLVGFERPPRDAAERQRADAAVAALKAAGALFKIDPAAACKPAQVELRAPALGLGAPAAQGAAGAGHAEHADLDADFRFDCADAARAGHIDIGLFAAFPRMRRIDAQVATDQGQSRQILKRGEQRLKLGR